MVNCNGSKSNIEAFAEHKKALGVMAVFMRKLGEIVRRYQLSGALLLTLLQLLRCTSATLDGKFFKLMLMKIISKPVMSTIIFNRP